MNSRQLVWAGLCISIMTGCLAGCGTESKESIIIRIENGLLPSVLIEGEPTYNLEERMAYYNVPGLSIAVIKDFKIDWIKNYGVGDAGQGDPVTDSTLFCVGSLSKAVSAATILRLVEQGQLDLDDDVNTRLKSWKVPENELMEKSRPTVRRLLNHSGGIMYSPPYGYTPENFPTLQQLLKGEPPATSKPVQVDLEPGSAFQYSNAGFTVLQLLVEDLSGKTFSDFAKEAIFAPLGMRHSTFEHPLPPAKEAYAAAGHRPNGETYDLKRPSYPHLAAGGLWTTAEEYAKFIIEIQKSLQGKSNLIFSRELAREMVSPHDAENYGLGVFLADKGDFAYFSHIGDATGFLGGFNAHPTDGYGAVIVVNNNNAIPLIREIFKSIGKEYNWQSYLPEVHRTIELPEEKIAACAGRYRGGSDSFIELYHEDGRLFMRSTEHDGIRLYPISEDSLITKERLGEVVLVRNEAGEIVEAIYRMADDIGRLPEMATSAVRMENGEKIPFQMLLGGETEAAIAAYKKLKKADPNDADISETRFNRLGYEFLSQNKLDEALAVFSVNIALYPQSGNSWDSMGEALLESGDKAGALKHYKKALELDPNNGNAARVIKELSS